jgi:hypothetical protein
MGSYVSKAVSLTALILALSTVGEMVVRLSVNVQMPWFFYATMSGVLLGFVPSAPILTSNHRLTAWGQATLVILLFGLVLVNSALVALLNRSDLGWSKGDYFLAFPALAFAITCLAAFYAFRTGKTLVR